MGKATKSIAQPAKTTNKAIPAIAATAAARKLKPKKPVVKKELESSQSCIATEFSKPEKVVSPAVTRSSSKRNRSSSRSLSTSGSSTESVSLLSSSTLVDVEEYSDSNSNSSVPTVSEAPRNPEVSSKIVKPNAKLEIPTTTSSEPFLVGSSEGVVHLNRTPPRPLVRRKCSPLQNMEISSPAKQSETSHAVDVLLGMDFEMEEDDTDVLQNSDPNISIPFSPPITPTTPPSGNTSRSRSRNLDSNGSSPSPSPSSWSYKLRPNFHLSKKIAKHFVYLGHREEAVTTTAKEVEKRYVVQCKYCPADSSIYAGHTSTYGNLTRHLAMSHGIGKVLECSPVPRDAELGFYSKRNPKQKLYELNCVRYLVLNNHAFQMSRWDAFQIMVASLDPCIRPMSGRTMSRRMDECSLKAKSDLRQLFRSIPYVSIVVDGWSTKKNKGVIAVMAMYVTESFQWGSRMLALKELKGRHTGVALRACVNEILLDFELEEKVSSIVIDNGSNMVAAFDAGSKKRNSLQTNLPRPLGPSHSTYRCSAHTLQLVVKNANLGHVGTSVNKAMLCITKIMRSQLLRDLLLLQTGRGFPKKSETRWNAEFDIIYLLLEPRMFNAVNSIIHHALAAKSGSFFVNSLTKPEVLTETDHRNLKVYCSLLGPLAEATDKLQSDGITAGNILPTLLETYQRLVTLEVNDDTLCVRSAVLSEFLTRFAPWFSDPVLVAATFLHPWRKLYMFNYMRLYNYEKDIPIMSDANIIANLEEFCVATSSDQYGIPTSYSTTTKMDDEDKKNPLSRKTYSKSEKLHNYTNQESIGFLEHVVGASSSAASESQTSPEKNNSFLRIIALEIQAYLFEKIVDEDIVDYWTRKATTFPMLANLFRAIMSRPASTAAVERLFSRAGIICRDRRCNTHPTTLQKILVTREWFESSDALTLKKVPLDDSTSTSESDDSIINPADSADECMFDIDMPSITQSPKSPPKSKSKSKKSKKQSLASAFEDSEDEEEPELVDFETALRMITEDSGEDDDDAIYDWEEYESQAQGWGDDF